MSDYTPPLLRHISEEDIIDCNNDINHPGKNGGGLLHITRSEKHGEKIQCAWTKFS